MSDEIPERREFVRSTIITVIFTVLFLSLALAFWAWSVPEVVDVTPVGALNEINPYIAIVLEILFMLAFYIFLTVTLLNFRLYLTNIRAGWFEIVATLVLVVIFSYLMFGIGVTMAAFVLCLSFVVYLYLLQE